MVYILGVSHDIQYDRSLLLTKNFTQFLVEHVELLGIEVLGEEWNENAVNTSDNPETIVKQISADKGIQYIAFDPNIVERKELKVPNRDEIRVSLGWPPVLSREQFEKLKREERKYNPVREEFWYHKIKPYVTKNMLLICGADHITKSNPDKLPGFDILLASKQVPTQVINATFVSPNSF